MSWFNFSVYIMQHNFFLIWAFYWAVEGVQYLIVLNHFLPFLALATFPFHPSLVAPDILLFPWNLSQVTKGLFAPPSPAEPAPSPWCIWLSFHNHLLSICYVPGTTLCRNKTSCAAYSLVWGDSVGKGTGAKESKTKGWGYILEGVVWKGLFDFPEG